MTKEEFKPILNRLLRQLDERAKVVESKKQPEKYYQDKRQEFIILIDSCIEAGWFKMHKGTRIHNIYYDTF